MTSHRTIAARFIRLTEKAGATVHASYAGTGSIYVTVTGPEDSIKVRFADHGECYCREDISVDPDGCTYEQAVRATMRMTGLNLSRSLSAIAAAANRRATKAAEEAANSAPIFAEAQAYNAARIKFQAEYIARKLAARDEPASKKTLKRYRAEANKEFAAHISA